MKTDQQSLFYLQLNGCVMDQIVKTPRNVWLMSIQEQQKNCIIQSLYLTSLVSYNLLILLLVILFLEVVGVIDEVDKLIDGILPLPAGLTKSFL